jgi:hypothetical protein
MQVIVDFENTSFFRLWFFIYYAASFILLMAYSFWAGWLTSEDKTISVWPQMSIVLMQSILLFMFWLNIVGMEEQLVPLNKVIENSPNSAKVRGAGGCRIRALAGYDRPVGHSQKSILQDFFAHCGMDDG